MEPGNLLLIFIVPLLVLFSACGSVAINIHSMSKFGLRIQCVFYGEVRSSFTEIIGSGFVVDCWSDQNGGTVQNIHLEMM